MGGNEWAFFEALDGILATTTAILRQQLSRLVEEEEEILFCQTKHNKKNYSNST